MESCLGVVAEGLGFLSLRFSPLMNRVGGFHDGRNVSIHHQWNAVGRFGKDDQSHCLVVAWSGRSLITAKAECDDSMSNSVQACAFRRTTGRGRK